MKRSLLILPAFVLLLGYDTLPPERVGLGIASIHVAPGVRFGLFSSPDAADPVATVDLVEDPSIQSVVLGPSTPEWLRPETLWLDYSLLAFRVLREAESALEVVVDTASGRTLWLHRQPEITFKPWAQYLVEDVTALYRIDPTTNPLRMTPDASAAVVPHEGGDCFAAVEVRGEWARVQTSELCLYEGSDVEPVEDAWVRWHDGTRLLISYGLLC